jgi:hypothetical protein
VGNAAPGAETGRGLFCPARVSTLSSLNYSEKVSDRTGYAAYSWGSDDGGDVPERFLTTTESAAWLREHYGMDIGAHTIRRLAKDGTLKTHKPHAKSWYKFSRETLAAHAESQGFT